MESRLLVGSTHGCTLFVDRNPCAPLSGIGTRSRASDSFTHLSFFLSPNHGRCTGRRPTVAGKREAVPLRHELPRRSACERFAGRLAGLSKPNRTGDLRVGGIIRHRNRSRFRSMGQGHAGQSGSTKASTHERSAESEVPFRTCYTPIPGHQSRRHGRATRVTRPRLESSVSYSHSKN